MSHPAHDWLGEVLLDYSEQQAPVTYTLIGLVIGIFLVEIYFTVTRGLASTQVFATGLFGVLPSAAWPLSPLLHKGSLHFIASVGGLWLLGIPSE